MPGKADSMTYGPTNFTEYLAALRAKATVLAISVVEGEEYAARTNAEVLALVKDEYIKQHEMAVAFQFIGDDANGAPVWRLGTIIALQDLTAQLAANVAAGNLRQIPGAEAAYSCNLSLR